MKEFCIVQFLGLVLTLTSTVSKAVDLECSGSTFVST